MISTIIILALVLGILIFVHELFHFAFAKMEKMRVEEFGIGYPPRIVGVYKSGNKKKLFFGAKTPETKSTIYSLNWIPFGGFTKIFGMEEREEEEGSFFTKSIGARARVVFAGVFGNIILAGVLFSIAFSLGLPQQIEKEIPNGAMDVGVQIISISENSPADNAGIKLGDRISRMETSKQKIEVKEVSDVQNFTEENIDFPIILTIKRGKKTAEYEVIARKNPPEGEGSIGVALARTARVSYPLHTSIVKGFEAIFFSIKSMLSAFYEIINNFIFGKETSGLKVLGPIGIGSHVSQMAELGFVYVVQFTAIFSINLVILNLLPFPALDGGYLLLLLLEKVRKKPVKIETENRINQIGIVFLIILMITITFKDIYGLIF